MRLAALLLLAALPLRATTVTLEIGGAAGEKGEVCWFRAGDPENPFQRWLTAPDVKCAAAGTPLTLPPGLWNVFGRTADAISLPRLVSSEAMPEALALALRPAATLETSRSAIAYAPRLAAAWPATLVPADEELLLFVMEKGAPVAVVPVPALAAGARRSIDATTGPSAIIGWMHVPERDRAALASAHGLSSPRVRAGSIAADPLPPLDLLNGAFVRIRGVDAGSTEIAVEGRGFIPYRRGVKVESSITTLPDPLIVRPAATLVVHWSTKGDVLALDRSLGSCKEAEPALPTIAIASCTQPAPGRAPDPSSCSVIREEAVDLSPGFGAITLEDIPPGTYRTELRIGKLPPAAATASVGALQLRHTTLHAEYFTLYGSVTLGGEPLQEDVELRFPGGGYGFQSRDDDEYRAALLAPLIGSDIQVSVNACDGEPRTVVIADQLARGVSRFDVDIPANVLRIRVSDTFTREPLDGATVRYTLMSKLMRPQRRPIFTRTYLAADGGMVAIPHVPEREIQLHVTHSGYQKKDVEPFSITKSETRDVDVQLVPLRGTHGRVFSPKPFENGTVLWFAPSGVETERADLGPDGVFVYANRHGPEETMTVVSSSHPLWVTQARSFNVPFPDVNARTVLVEVEGADIRDTRHVGVVIGGIRVPMPALQLHQSLRRELAAVRSRGPLALRDLADITPLEILLGPQVGEVSARAAGMDFFALEQFANPPKQAVPPGAARVVFVVGR